MLTFLCSNVSNIEQLLHFLFWFNSEFFLEKFNMEKKNYAANKQTHS